MGTETEDQTNFNPNRRLCPNGACIGVVGPSGKCLVCGTNDPGWTPDMVSDSLVSPPPLEAPSPAPIEPTIEAAVPGARRLCPDGNCIGILGSDGACGTCGKREESATTDSAS